MGIRSVLAVVAASWAAAGGGAWGQNAPAFPAAFDRDTLLLWLQRETDIVPDRVVAVTPQAVTSVVSTFPGGGGQPPRVVIRAEALSAETYAQAGALSWHVSVSADCAGRRIRLGETTGYPQRNLLGERRTLRPAESDWRPIQAGTALELAWRAACEPAFRGPFHGESLRMARADAAADAAPAPPQAASPQPAEPSPSYAPEAAAPATSVPAPAAAKAGSGPVVQVGAAPTEAEARRLLETLPGGLAGHEGRVETATVSGRVWRRAVVGGFADRAAAVQFCDALKRARRDCFVRN
ncbi:MAG: SPOR domain-containing protein [Pseudomonadota bacterium]